VPKLSGPPDGEGHRQPLETQTFTSINALTLLDSQSQADF